MIDNIKDLNERFFSGVEDLKNTSDEVYNNGLETLTDQDDIDNALEKLVLIAAEAKLVSLALTNHTIKFEDDGEG